MEGTQQAQTTPYPTTESVGFPPQSSRPQKQGLPKWVFIVVIGLIIIGGAAFLVLRGGDDLGDEPEVTNNTIDFIATPTPIGTPDVSPTPTAIDKAGVAIEILNGTGITGEAGYLESQLKSIGYTNTKTGNNSGSNVSTTSFSYSSSLSQSAIDEITSKLQSIYQKVDAKVSSSLGVYDASIVVGLRKGATPKPESVATPQASASPTPTATP